MKPGLLVIDDEAAICMSIKFALEDDYQVYTTIDPKEGIEWVKSKRIDIVLLDLRMGAVSGLDILKKVREIRSELTAIMMTAFASIETSIEAIKQGAYYYIEKPIDMDKLSVLIMRALQYRQVSNRLESKDKQLEARAFLGTSKAMQQVFSMIDRIKDIDSSVLITGESGTGKELVAREIHFSGRRYQGPLEIVNCAAIPDNLLESELFGYEKGAFTGATQSKDGKCVAANGGTLFLDEMSELPLSLQAKLLRVIQEREVTPLGSNKKKQLDIRIISAANKNIAQMVKNGEFREDLYFRLNVIPIHMPPLRQRKEDIPLLINHLIQKFNQSMNKQKEGLTPKAMEVLLHYPYAGNVRELGNIIEYAVALSMDRLIDVLDLPHFVQGHAEHPMNEDEMIQLPLGIPMKEVEKRVITATLKHYKDHRQKTAHSLQISERSLRDKLKNYKK
ncbi:sigma-54-dependent transcriptional regulator [Cytobacillus sp. FSL R7-0680]|uniref:sigma-54-dependent transcriptional regulator n=1 Tax=Cytobacillus sp. FSL R7-0680 TaxID=2921689 RepID=UPI0030FC4E0C